MMAEGEAHCLLTRYMFGQGKQQQHLEVRHTSQTTVCSYLTINDGDDGTIDCTNAARLLTRSTGCVVLAPIWPALLASKWKRQCNSTATTSGPVWDGFEIDSGLVYLTTDNNGQQQQQQQQHQQNSSSNGDMPTELGYIHLSSRSIRLRYGFFVHPQLFGC